MDEQVRPSLEKLFTEDNATAIAAYIIDKMQKEAGPETLEFEFTLLSQDKGGGMEINDDKNVWFKFDIDKGSVLDVVRNEMYAAEPTEYDLLAEDDFKILIGKKFLEHHKLKLAALLRKHMFKGKIVPIRPQQVSEIHVLDFSAMGDFHNYQLVVEKSAPSDVLTASVSAELIAIHDATGKDLAEIIAEKQAEGDPAYKYVKTATKKKYLWDCQIDLLVEFF